MRPLAHALGKEWGSGLGRGRGRRLGPGLALALALAPAPGPGLGLAGSALAAAPNLPDSGSLVLRPEDDRELCRDLQAGEVLQYRFDANQPLVFTAHYHRGDEARSLWRKDELRHDEGELKAAVAARYCLTWFDYLDGALTLHWQVHQTR